MGATEPIAIIGMAGRFPAADGIDEFWANLAAGRDCLTELSDEELLRNHEQPGRIGQPQFVRKRPVTADSDAFDAALFGMTPREAELRDPQYRLMMETVHAALEHGGYDPSAYAGHIGLYAGTNANRYRYDYIEKRPEVVRSAGFMAIDVTNNPDYLTTYISYKLGLRGPSATILTACSTSLVAVHMATTAIRVGDCDMAIAGGVDIEFPFHQGYLYRDGGIHSRDGTPRAFDAAATGTNFGDGVGAVLLKPLAAALRDGDTIYATILGSAVNNDGNRKVGYTAPSVEGQSECVGKALRNAGVSPRDIDYVEAHGTATRVGDPIEVTGLIEAYRRTSPEPLPTGYCALGSVKSNIGHLGQAAGVAALIKTTLALTHRQIPPSIHFTTPNPGVDWSTAPFAVNTELRDWPVVPGKPRLAAVSSFGVGGTNAHLILQEAPDQSGQPRPAGPQAVLWSAMNDAAELALRERLATHLAGLSEDAFPDAAHTLRVGRIARPVRAAVLAEGAADAAAALRDPTRVLRSDGATGSIVFALPGQGALRPHACRALYDTEPLFREGCDAAFDILRPLLDRDLRELWLSCDDPDVLGATEVAQPLLFTLEYTLAQCLRHWGVEPAMLLGHSVGELVAAAVAGVFDLEAGLRAVAGRARCMAAMPNGRMLAVSAGPDEVAGLLGDELVIAAINGPRQVVLSGPPDAVDAAAAVLNDRNVASRALVTSHAFHSPAMAGAVGEFNEVLAGLTLNAPVVPLISAATGARITDDEARSPQFWARQLTEPVNFDLAVRTMLSAGPVTVVEVGPGRTLAALLRGRSDLRASQSRVLQSVTPDAGLDGLLTQLWVDGLPVTYWRRRADDGYRRVAVPGYPYQRKRYWLDRPAAQDPVPTPAPAVAPASVVATEPVSAAEDAPWQLAELEWFPDRRPADPARTPTARRSGAAVVLVPDDPAAARTAQATLQRAGYRTVRVSDGRHSDPGPGVIDPARPDDWLPILEKLAERSPGSVLIGHAVLLEPLAAHEDLHAATAAALDGLQGSLRAAAAFQRRHRVPTEVLLLGRGLVDVTGAEPVDPLGAALLALLRSAAKELPGVRCRAIDVDGTAEDLLAEVIAEPDPPLVALRGQRRWHPRLVRVTPYGEGSQLRPGGTYLITGGLGGIGLVVARALAETGLGLRLALLGRSGLTDRSDPDRTRIEGDLAELIDAGAEIEVVTGDVADPAALAAAVDRVEARFGPVNGVVHSAGVAGGGLLERRDAAEMRAVLRPKTAGVLALETVFQNRAPLDFLVLFSSQAAHAGLYGSADYAAANAFLDAHARRHANRRRRTVSVQWPGWAEVGMLARSDSAHTVLPSAARAAEAEAEALAGESVALRLVRTPDRDWEFDEHIFHGSRILPGTALLEFAVMAGRAAGISAEGPLEVRGAAFLAPVPGDRPREIRVLLAPAASMHRFRVQCRPAGTEDGWTDHATGVLGAAAEMAAPAVLSELAARLPLRTGGGSGKADWMEFGPRWATSTEVRGNDTERLVRLVLPPRYHDDLTEHPLHPALLDVAAHVLTDLVPGRRYAPFMYRRVLVLGTLPADITVHSRFAAGGRAPRATDFDVYDTATGALLVHADSFAIREVSDKPFVTTTSAARPTRPAPSGLLNPDHGAAAFLDLLRSGTPPVVLVDIPGARMGVDEQRQAAPPQAPGSAVGVEPVIPPPAAVPDTPAEPAAGEDAVLTGLRGLWADALGVAKIGPDDDFFDLGGNSLTAVQLAARIGAHFGVEVGAGSLFDSTTLRRLASEIRDLGGRPAGAAA